jgi:hypothetical protein
MLQLTHIILAADAPYTCLFLTSCCLCMLAAPSVTVFMLQLTYNHVSHPSSFFTSVLLGSATTSSPNVVVKSLRLGLQEAVIRAEVYAPRWVAGGSSSSSSVRQLSLWLGLQDAVIRAEVHAPRWVAGSSRSSSSSSIVQCAVVAGPAGCCHQSRGVRA